MTSSSFEFFRGNERLDWGVLVSIDVDRLMKDTNVDTLQRIVENLAFARITRDEAAMFTPEHTVHLFQLAQLVVQYLVYSQECLAKMNVRLNEHMSQVQHAVQVSEGAQQNLAERNAELTKEVKAQRRTLMAYEFNASDRQRATSPHSRGQYNGGFSCMCPVCGEGYHKIESLQSHIRKRHGNSHNQQQYNAPVMAQQPVAAPPAQAPAPVAAAQVTTAEDVVSARVHQQEMQRLQDRLDMLERQLQLERGAADKQQRDQLMALLLQQQNNINNNNNNNSQSQNTAPTPPPPPPPAPAPAPPPPLAQNTTIATALPGLPGGGSATSAAQTLPSSPSSVPVMPDIAAMIEYNASRQKEHANNALVRQMMDLEKEIQSLRAEKDAAAKATPPPPQPTAAVAGMAVPMGAPTTMALPTPTAATLASSHVGPAGSIPTPLAPGQQQQPQPQQLQQLPGVVAAPTGAAGLLAPPPSATPAGPPTIPTAATTSPGAQPVMQQQQPTMPSWLAGATSNATATTPATTTVPPPQSAAMAYPVTGVGVSAVPAWLTDLPKPTHKKPGSSSSTGSASTVPPARSGMGPRGPQTPLSPPIQSIAAPSVMPAPATLSSAQSPYAPLAVPTTTTTSSSVPAPQPIAVNSIPTPASYAPLGHSGVVNAATPAPTPVPTPLAPGSTSSVPAPSPMYTSQPSIPTPSVSGNIPTPMAQPHTVGVSNSFISSNAPPIHSLNSSIPSVHSPLKGHTTTTTARPSPLASTIYNSHTAPAPNSATMPYAPLAVPTTATSSVPAPQPIAVNSIPTPASYAPLGHSGVVNAATKVPTPVPTPLAPGSMSSVPAPSPMYTSQPSIPTPSVSGSIPTPTAQPHTVGGYFSITNTATNAAPSSSTAPSPYATSSYMLGGKAPAAAAPVPAPASVAGVRTFKAVSSSDSD